MAITQKELSKILNYDPETGIFTWATTSKNNLKKSGDTAGCKNTIGYVQIQIDKKVYLAHRLAFLFMEGYIPEHVVDHKNGIKDDNRWTNLRHVTVRCNLQNGRLNKNNKSGFNGVYKDKYGRWKATIKINRKRIDIGSFDNPTSAAIARVNFEDNCDEWNCNYQDYNRKKLKNLGLYSSENRLTGKEA